MTNKSLLNCTSSGIRKVVSLIPKLKNQAENLIDIFIKDILLDKPLVFCDKYYFFDTFYEPNYNSEKVKEKIREKYFELYDKIWNEHNDFVNEWVEEHYYECECLGIEIDYGQCKCNHGGDPNRERHSPYGSRKIKLPELRILKGEPL